MKTKEWNKQVEKLETRLKGLEGESINSLEEKLEKLQKRVMDLCAKAKEKRNGNNHS